jgi:hypothetical protein
MVVILGGQPGGNQALIEGARREIHRLVRSKIRAYRRSPGLLPALAASEKERPDGAPDLPNLFRIVYEALDCIFGYWLLVRRSLGRKCVAAVFDGYPYDDFADSRGWVRRSARLLARLMPRPDVIVRLPTQRATEESKRAGVELDRRLIARGAHVEKLAGYEDSPAVKEVVRIVFEALRRRLADSAESRSGRTIDARSANTADRMANAGANPDYELRAAHHE